MFHQGHERLLTDPKCVRLLFDDMTFHVIYSFYPCTADDAAHLAAIQLKIACECPCRHCVEGIFLLIFNCLGWVITFFLFPISPPCSVARADLGGTTPPPPPPPHLSLSLLSRMVRLSP